MVQNNKKSTNGQTDAHGRELVSIIMPAYNAARTITGAINSILTQTYGIFELIIIDDGSTDATNLFIKAFKDKRIRAYFCPHRGIVEARNFGNLQAKGTICVTQDSDDFSLPDRLEKIKRVFDETGAQVVIHSAYVNAWNKQYVCMERHYLKAEIGEDAVLHNRVLGWPAYRREVWKAKPFRKETQYAYDLMMHLDWTLSGYKYAVIDEGLYEYVRYQGSASDRFEREGKRAKSMKKIKQIVKKEYGKTIA